LTAGRAFGPPLKSAELGAAIAACTEVPQEWASKQSKMWEGAVRLYAAPRTEELRIWSGGLSRVFERKSIFDLRLVRNSGYVGISNIVYAASQWGIIVLVTKLGALQDVGRLALALAVVTPWMTLLGGGLRVFIATDLEHKYSFGDYLTVRGSQIVQACLSLCSLHCHAITHSKRSSWSS